MIARWTVVFVASLLLVCTQASAHANFSGHWLATSGTVTSTVGISAKCSRVEIEIIQTEDVIHTRIYDSTCEPYSSKWGPITQTIKDGKVFERGVEVGKITDDTMITVSKSGQYQYAYNLKVVTGADGKTQLMSYYGVKGAIGAMVTEATLDRL